MPPAKIHGTRHPWATAGRWCDSIAVHERKVTRGWGPTPVTDPDTMQVLGFEVEEVARFDRINKQTRKQRLYA